MEKRLIMFVIFMALGLLFISTLAFADPVAPTSKTAGVSSSRDLTSLPTQQVNAMGGNITPLNLSAIAITKSWQGYYGDVTGVITLDDANNKTFYNWSLTTPKGEIFATRISNPSWSSVVCLDAAGITAEETALGQTASDADSVSNTYSNSTDHPQFTVGGTTIPAGACYATNAFGPSGSQTASFFQMLLKEGGGNIVYATTINASQTGFDGNAWDFELLVGENEHAGSEGVTPYYFWVELG